MKIIRENKKKKCTKCGGFGPFYQWKTGLSARCKNCIKKTIYEHRKKTNYASNKKYFKTKHGKAARRRVIARYNNSKHGIEQQRANRISSVENFLRYKLTFIRSKSRTKNRQMNLDLKYLIKMHSKQGGRCNISSVQMTTRYNDLCSISIDRINSSKGYIKGNVQLVCRAINLAKQHLSNRAMIVFIKKVRSCAIIEYGTRFSLRSDIRRHDNV